MSKKFTKQQREVLARKLGYEGPMNMFDQFVKSDPAMERKYSTVVEKYMARGGMVKKYQEGGAVTAPTLPDNFEPRTMLELGLYNAIKSTEGQLAPWKAALEKNPNDPSAKGFVEGLGTSLENLKKQLNNAYVSENTRVEEARKDIISGYINKTGDVLLQAKEVADRFGPQSHNYVVTEEGWQQQLAIHKNAAEKALQDMGMSLPPELADLNSFQKIYTPEVLKRIKQEDKRLIDEALNYLSAPYQTQEERDINRDKYLDLSNKNTSVRRDLYLQPIQQTSQATPTQEAAGEEAKPWVTFGEQVPGVDRAYEALRALETRTTPSPTPTTTTPTTTEPVTIPGAGVSDTTTPTTTPVTTPTTTAPTGGTTGGGAETTATTTPQIPTGGTTGTTTPTTTGGMTGTQMANIPTTNTVPRVNIPQVTAATIPTEPGQMIAPTGAPAQAAQIAGATVPGVAQVTPTAPQTAATMEAATATGAVSGELAGLQPEQGAVSQQAQVQAATMEPTSTALKDLQAAQGVAGQVTGAPTRELVAGELVEGPTVDRAAVEATLAKNEAAQGVVTEDMTVQGQLAKLTTNFEANNPPAWAAGALRNATAAMAQRGLAASSLAGQALIQATIESALPIASADAQIYREMGIQNLTNKQQMAVLSAQQRAAFLGQEFDQAFQARVTNAATISEIANLNFSAKQQVALENARLTESVNLANLNNRQALVMANAAQIATLETTNLNNRQQANVLNAQAFLQMDLTNLSNRQQTALFKSQSMIQSILSDQAAENAARQFNAASENQVNQFYDGLTAQIKQFNATQANAMNQFNVSQINSVSEFNATQQNARDQFNAEYRRVIDQSNAEWRRNIALADTAAINRANEVNANAALGITTIEYNNLWQSYRDQIEYSWKTGENALDRENELARQVLAKQATIEAAKFQIEAAKYQALGGLAAQIFDKGGIAAGIGSFLGTAGGAATGLVSGAMSGINNLLFGVNRNVNFIETTGPNVGWSYYSNGTDTVGVDTNGSVYYNGTLVADDQLAYTGFTPPSGEIDWDIWSSGGMDSPQPEVDNYIFPTD